LFLILLHTRCRPVIGIVYRQTYMIPRTAALELAFETLQNAYGGDPSCTIMAARKAGKAFSVALGKDLSLGAKNATKRVSKMLKLELAEQLKILGTDLPAVKKEWAEWEKALAAIIALGNEAVAWVAASITQSIDTIRIAGDALEGAHAALTARCIALDTEAKVGRKKKQGDERLTRMAITKDLKPWEQAKLATNYRHCLAFNFLTLRDPSAAHQDIAMYTEYVATTSVNTEPMTTLEAWGVPTWFNRDSVEGARFIVFRSNLVMRVS
jgi:hypothetical protein